MNLFIYAESLMTNHFVENAALTRNASSWLVTLMKISHQMMVALHVTDCSNCSWESLEKPVDFYGAVTE